MSKNTIIIIGVVVVLSFVGYTVFFKGDSNEKKNGLVSSGATAEAPVVGAKIIKVASSLERLNLDTGFFQNGLFRGLKNFTKPVPAQPVGRPNPFAPIGASADSSAGASVGGATIIQNTGVQPLE